MHYSLKTRIRIILSVTSLVILCISFWGNSKINKQQSLLINESQHQGDLQLQIHELQSILWATEKLSQRYHSGELSHDVYNKEMNSLIERASETNQELSDQQWIPVNDDSNFLTQLDNLSLNLDYYRYFSDLKRDTPAYNRHYEIHFKPVFMESWKILSQLDQSLQRAENLTTLSFASTVNRMNFFIVLLTISAVILMVIFYYALGKILLKPINLLTHAMEKEANAEPVDNLPSNNCLEITTLNHAFNNMKTQISQRQAELIKFSQTDRLTGLANRTLLIEKMKETIAACDKNQTKAALLILDLDRFKEINDTIGHDVGDILLQDAACRLSNTLTENDVIARLGGDEFAILCKNIDKNHSEQFADHIVHILNRPFLINVHQLHIGASVGLAIYPDHASNVMEMMRYADVAMYVAKKNRQGYAIYHPQDDQNSIDRLSLVSELRDAINCNSLELYYQPKYSFVSSCTVETEALLRWFHPHRGFIPPDLMIEIAEESGLIHPLTEWVIQTALNQIKTWNQTGISIGVAVNLSALNLQNPHLMTMIQFMLDVRSINPNQLVLEVTESAMMENPELAMSMLSGLYNMGIKIAIDDFGTGYSSLAYLKNLPVNELKIDRSFVTHIDDDRRDRAIVQSTIDLAHNLGLTVVAEGIENQDAWNILAEMECDLIQGYFLSKPLPAKDFEQWFLSDARNVANFS